MKDTLNPTYYQGLGNLVACYENGNFIPAQAIDVIEAVTREMPGSMAPNMGNVVKYFLRCGKKAPDASYQSSQDEKNFEESGKIVWYAKRWANVAKREAYKAANHEGQVPLKYIFVNDNGTTYPAGLDNIYMILSETNSDKDYQEAAGKMCSAIRICMKSYSEEAQKILIEAAENFQNYFKRKIDKENV